MILVVPCSEAGRGGGHFIRCDKLVKDLRALGREAFLFSETENINKDWRLIVLDRFQTPREEIEHWKKHARHPRTAVIGIDEGGSCRDGFDFLIDILPNIEKIKPNIADISLLPPPEKKPKPQNHDKRLKILISFGLEDSAGLGEKTREALGARKDGDMEITFLNSENRVPNLAAHLHEYDLVFTHYGITAFEALYAGTPVVLFNPTKYHEKLSKKAGFKTIKSINSLVRIRSFGSWLKKNKITLSKNRKSLAELITAFSPHVNRFCPVCGTPAPARSEARFPDRTCRSCKNCGIIFMDRLTPSPVEYGQKYFFEQYQKQYGKTYLEDFPNLISMSKKRIKHIKKISESKNIKLLDIGCAYGAFLAAAKNEGFTIYGMEPAEEAVKYANETLNIRVIHGFFPFTPYPLPSALDVITLWFTIEHFQNCEPVLKEINRLLKPNGILAFSTPSFSGISGRKNLRKFLENSPADHFTIWSPKMCKKALALHGFKVIKTLNTGHHPKRFPVIGKLAFCKASPAYWLLLSVSKLLGLGDTFEVYAVKSN